MTDPRSQPDSPTPARVAGAAARLRADLPLLFLAYALPAVIFLAVAMPPFQVADELAHTLRADQISLGQIVSPRLGGDVHGDLVVFGAMYQPLWFHSEVKQTVELARRAGALAWSPWIKDENFQNTAQYGPFLYAPQVAGLWLGEAIGLSCAQTLVLARLVNGLTASVLAFLALRRCRRGRALLFATLLLPMTLSELGSASQDALIIGLSILAAAIASRVLSEERSARVGEFALFAFTVVATTLARPSQLALVLLAPAFVARHDPRWRAKLAIAAPAVFAVVGWLAFLPSLMPPVPSDWSAAEQLAHLIAHPLALPRAIVETISRDAGFLFSSLIGRLGWLDTPMPSWFLRSAGVGLLLALFAPGNRGSALLPAILGVSTFLALLTTTGFALYLSWTPVAKPIIDGLQGRYILPVLPLLAWAVPAYGRRLERALLPLWAIVVAFPMLTLATLPAVIMRRYYGSWAVMAESMRVLLLP